MNSHNIFDLFGRQKKSLNNESDIISKTLLLIVGKQLTEHKKIESEINKIRDYFSNIDPTIKKTEGLVNAISLSKNYISLNKKRIVNVKPSINKYDVVIKGELDEVLNSVIKVGIDHSKTKKDLIELTDAVINLAKYVEDIEERLEKELRILFAGIDDEIKELNTFRKTTETKLKNIE